ncbi:peptide deformylase [Candidatus Kaiserbacteria bacterium]|nr:peptide deformylase [Candidatus Kaiserbacteria bacterium]
MEEIVSQSNPILAQWAAPVPPEEITSAKIRDIIVHMKTLLREEPLGVAIAAPQIGESLRIFVVSGKALTKHKGDDAPQPDRTYINPEVLKISRKKKELHEGCLSVRSDKPDTLVWGTVKRADKMKIRAYDEHGTLAEHSATGFLAQIFQHEIDHLEGILYTSKAERVYEEKLSQSA